MSPDTEDRRTIEQAEKQVQAFLHVLRARYAIEEDDIPRMVDDIRWIAAHRRKMDKISLGIVLSFVGTVMAGAGLLLWEGLVALIKGHK